MQVLQLIHLDLIHQRYNRKFWGESISKLKNGLDEDYIIKFRELFVSCSMSVDLYKIGFELAGLILFIVTVSRI